MSSKKLRKEPIPYVSVLVQTYNQKDYIAECLEAILAQKCSFPIEILIYDDASTDGTATIVRRYKKKYPTIIKPICSKENMYGRVSAMRTFQLPRVKGQYVAICEGDDYWTDSGKLARQAAYMEAHPECALLTENGTVLYTATGKSRLFTEATAECDYTLEDLVIERRFPTASVFFRQSGLKAILALKGSTFDTAIWAALAQTGTVHYLPNISSVYRRGTGMTTGDPIAWAKAIKRFDKTINTNFKLSLRARRERGRGIFWAMKEAAVAALKKGDFKQFVYFSREMVKASPETLVKTIYKRVRRRL